MNQSIDCIWTKTNEKSLAGGAACFNYWNTRVIFLSAELHIWENMQQAAAGESVPKGNVGKLTLFLTAISPKVKERFSFLQDPLDRAGGKREKENANLNNPDLKNGSGYHTNSRFLSVSVLSAIPLDPKVMMRQGRLWGLSPRRFLAEDLGKKVEMSHL